MFLMDVIATLIEGPYRPTSFDDHIEKPQEPFLGDRIWTFLSSIKPWFQSLIHDWFHNSNESAAPSMSESRIIDSVTPEEGIRVDMYVHRKKVDQSAEEKASALLQKLENLDINSMKAVNEGLELVRQIRPQISNSDEISRVVDQKHQQLMMASVVYSRV